MHGLWAGVYVKYNQLRIGLHGYDNMEYMHVYIMILLYIDCYNVWNSTWYTTSDTVCKYCGYSITHGYNVSHGL